MRPVIAVGLDSTLDILVTFPNLDNFRKFARGYRGSLSSQVINAYAAISGDIGGEVPIDGKVGEVKKIVELAIAHGAEIKYSLGGNGAQEAAAVRALGGNVIFVGGLFQNLKKAPPESLRHFESSDLSFACKLYHQPVSLIFQTRDTNEYTNRYILCEGKGRRIAQLRGYIRKLPDILNQIQQDRGGLDMISLVGWHVMFAAGINSRDFQLVKDTIEKIREATGSPLFTDAGSLAAYSERGRKYLCEIYSLFDYLSVNDEEAVQISETLEAEAVDEFQAMRDLLDSSENLSTIWLHTPEYQVSLSTRHSKKLLEKAQMNAAAAGVFRVETGRFPNFKELVERARVRNYSEEGKVAVKKILKEYATTVKGGELVATPCFKRRSFFSSVGAGDTASAAYIYSIVSSSKK